MKYKIIVSSLDMASIVTADLMAGSWRGSWPGGLSSLSGLHWKFFLSTFNYKAVLFTRYLNSWGGRSLLSNC